MKTRWAEVEPNFTFDPALYGFPARGHNLQFWVSEYPIGRLSQGLGNVASPTHYRLHLP